jgi:hypothetical protein
MNAATLVRADLAKIARLTQQVVTSPPVSRTRARLLGRLRRALEIHAHVEEEIFLPAVEEVDAVAAALAEAARREHRRLAALAGAATRSGQVRALGAGIFRHVAGVDGQLLPRVERALGEDALARLGVEMRARKRQLASRRGRIPPLAA